MFKRLLTIIGILLSASTYALGDDFSDKIKIFEKYSFNDSKVVSLDNFEIELAYGKVILQTGKIYFCSFYEDRPCRGFFEGKGIFYYTPPNNVEEHQVARFYGTKMIEFQFEHAHFAFPWNSKRFDELYLNSKHEKAPYRAKKYFNKARDIPDKKFKYNLPFHILKAGCEGYTQYLYADFMHGEYEHVVYAHDPVSVEQISVYDLRPKFKLPQLVSSARDTASYGNPGIEKDLDILTYNMEVEISTTGKSDIVCKVMLNVNSDSLKYVDLTFPPEYKIDSVAGDISGFIKDKDRAELLLCLSRYFKNDDTVQLTVYYRANLFRHYMGFGVTQKNLTSWYPYRGFRHLSNYDLKYQIDNGFEFISVGDKISDSVVDGRRHLHFVSPFKIAYVSFNYGLFDSVMISGADIPITLYYLRNRHGSPIFGRGYIKKIAHEISEAFKFYSEQFAPYPFDRLDIDAMAVGYGQGSPGVVHLAELTFDRSTSGIDDKFRAHEVAHQWWGHLVNPASYHDVWLSEALAEFSAALFIDLRKKDHKVYRDILKTWRSNSVKSGKLNGKKSEGFKAGAIILGHRLGSELSPGDYQAIIYNKAPYMLHMLRFELQNLTGSDNAFLDLLRDFAHKFGGGLATTEDFMKVTEKYLKNRTGTFFDQWLFDWQVPKIKSKYEIKNESAVEFSLTVTEVDASFSSPYLVRFNLDGGLKVEKVYYITKGFNKFKFADAGGTKIRSLDFNPYNDILEQ